LFLGFSLPFCVNFLRSAFSELGQTLQSVLRMLT
jgi:hypothetical protein